MNMGDENKKSQYSYCAAVSLTALRHSHFPFVSNITLILHPPFVCITLLIFTFSRTLRKVSGRRKHLRYPTPHTPKRTNPAP